MVPTTLKTCPQCRATVPHGVSQCSLCGHSFGGPAAPVAPIADKPDSNRLLIFLLLWFFAGGLGAHRLYLGHITTGIIQLALTAVGIVTSCIGIGFVLLAAVGVWVIVDLILALTGGLRPTDGARLV